MDAKVMLSSASVVEIAIISLPLLPSPTFHITVLNQVLPVMHLMFHGIRCLQIIVSRPSVLDVLLLIVQYIYNLVLRHFILHNKVKIFVVEQNLLTGTEGFLMIVHIC